MSTPGPGPSKWHPTTGYYDYNYGMGINYYQPMIDYIEEKERGGKTKYPHLPWTDERGLSQYDPMKNIKSYSNEALDRIARRTEASAKERLRDFKATTKSSFVLSKSVSAATITEKVNVTSRKKKELIRQIKTLKSKMAEDFGYDHRKEDRDIELALKSSQKYLRGRSAKGIEAFLQSESSKNIAQGIEYDTRNIQSKRFVDTHQYAKHMKVMEGRMLTQLEQKCVEPLNTLSHELKGFDKRTAEYFFDTRCLAYITS